MVFCVSLLNRLVQLHLDEHGIKETKESTLGKDSQVPFMHHDLCDLGLICLVWKCKIHFRTARFQKIMTINTSPVQKGLEFPGRGLGREERSV